MSSDSGDIVHANEKEQRWRAAEAAMGRLRDDADEWREYQAEAEQWETTSADGLDDLPYEFDVSRTQVGG